MSYLDKLKNTKDRVEGLIRDYPHLRDDDNKLMATIWWSECYKDVELSAREFLEMFSKGVLTNPESIRRCRAKIQEQDSSLRGEFYKQKKNDGKVVKNNIHKL